MESKKFLLQEKDIPTAWYNIVADMENKPLPPLNPKTKEPLKPEDLYPLFAKGLVDQEMNQTDTWIEIPEEVRDMYKIWRPTPLVRAYGLEKALDTPAHIYFKNESVSPVGSHKLNSAIPQYILMGQFHMTDRLVTLILMQAFSAFGIFLMRQFFMGLPNELREAGKIDGAGEFRIFWQIMLPQATPGIATLTIFTFIGQWNDYISPLIYLNSPELYTLQLGLKMFAGQYTMQYALTMAGTVCAMVPIFLVYLIFEKQITQGIAFTGMKG